MTTPYHALELSARTELARGGALVTLGLFTIAWPEVALPVAPVVAGVLVALSGAYDLFVALRSREGLRPWLALAGHGGAWIAFGVLTAALPFLAIGTAMLLVAAWLLLFGSMTAALALAVWPMRRTRYSLLAVAVIVFSLAALATLFGAGMPPFIPLYLGACVAVFLGALHLAGGVWLRHEALPPYAPTTQAAWSPADARAAGDPPRLVTRAAFRRS